MLDRSYFEKDMIACEDEDDGGYSDLSYHNIITAFLVVAVGTVASASALAYEWAFAKVTQARTVKYRLEPK